MKIGLPIKLSLRAVALIYLAVLVLFPLGAIGAAIASVITDAVLLVWFMRALYLDPVKEEVRQ